MPENIPIGKVPVEQLYRITCPAGHSPPHARLNYCTHYVPMNERTPENKSEPQPRHSAARTLSREEQLLADLAEVLPPSADVIEFTVPTGPQDEPLAWLTDHPWLDEELSETQTAYDAWVQQREAWLTQQARTGWQRHGPGILVFDVAQRDPDTDQPISRYLTASQAQDMPNPLLAELAAAYNPASEIVLAFLEPSGRTIGYRLPLTEDDA